MLAILSLLVNTIGWFGLPMPSRPSLVPLSPVDEHAPLIDPGSIPRLDGDTDLPNTTSYDPSTLDIGATSTVLQFMSQPTVWFLSFVVLLSGGPAEMSLTSIGAVADTFMSNAPVSLKARHVQLISLANTLTRLSSGWASDKLCQAGPKGVGQRLAFMATGPVLYTLICFYIAMGGQQLWLLSLTTGICYGLVFTLASVPL